ncbi:MAG: hypothetical protein SGPRY_002224 [Prymnesium sp.]
MGRGANSSSIFQSIAAILEEHDRKLETLQEATPFAEEATSDDMFQSLAALLDDDESGEDELQDVTLFAEEIPSEGLDKDLFDSHLNDNDLAYSGNWEDDLWREEDLGKLPDVSSVLGTSLFQPLDRGFGSFGDGFASEDSAFSKDMADLMMDIASFPLTTIAHSFAAPNLNLESDKMGFGDEWVNDLNMDGFERQEMSTLLLSGWFKKETSIDVSKSSLTWSDNFNSDAEMTGLDEIVQEHAKLQKDSWGHQIESSIPTPSIWSSMDVFGHSVYEPYIDIFSTHRRRASGSGWLDTERDFQAQYLPAMLIQSMTSIVSASSHPFLTPIEGFGILPQASNEEGRRDMLSRGAVNDYRWSQVGLMDGLKFDTTDAVDFATIDFFDDERVIPDESDAVFGDIGLNGILTESQSEGLAVTETAEIEPNDAIETLIPDGNIFMSVQEYQSNNFANSYASTSIMSQLIILSAEGPPSPPLPFSPPPPPFCPTDADLVAGAKPTLTLSGAGFPRLDSSRQLSSDQHERAFGFFRAAVPGASAQVLALLGERQYTAAGYTIGKPNAAVVQAITRTTVLYGDRNAMRVAYQVRDAVGESRVALSQLVVRLKCVCASDDPVRFSSAARVSVWWND